MSGECIVIEDGILADLRLRELENGPNRAIKEFCRDTTGNTELIEKTAIFMVIKRSAIPMAI